MGFIVWLVIGGVIGWLASIIMKTNAQMGIVANIIVGCVGAWLGGWLAGLLGIAAAGIGYLRRRHRRRRHPDRAASRRRVVQVAPAGPACRFRECGSIRGTAL